MSNIVDLPKTVKKLSAKNKAVFNRIFTVDAYTAQARVPKEMRSWVIKTFGSISAITAQKIVRVNNLISYESALFNELRASRPLTKSKIDLEAEIESFRGGPFDNPRKNTTEDVFGRVRGKHGITASNVAKYDKWHGMYIWNEHNPLKFTQASIIDAFEVGMKWYAKAHKQDKGANYPYILWNCLWRSGASIVHGHIQLMLGKKSHYANIEFHNKIRHGYKTLYGADYFEDLYTAHKAVGLGFQKGSVKVMAHLTPRKEKEVILIAPSMSKALYTSIYKVLKTFRDDLKVESFNVMIAMPPLTKDKKWAGFPIFVRIIDRGPLSNKTTDVAGLELVSGTSVVSSDPYKIIKKIKKQF